MRKHKIPPSAFDINTGDKIQAKSVVLERGKIFYIHTTQYDNPLPSMGIFDNKFNSNFMPATLKSNSFLGAASSHSKADTVITNDLLVLTALQETIDNTIHGFQYQYLPQEEFIDTAGRLNVRLIDEKYEPDILINLKELSLKVAGQTNKGTNVITSQPMMEMPGLYSYISPETNFYGNVFMDYTAVWEIVDVRRNGKREIRQNGRYISKYHCNLPLTSYIQN